MMTNREWLNTLSDEEYVEAIKNYISPFTDWIGVNWLSQPHETTADEDFKIIGYLPIKNCEGSYQHENGIKEIWVEKKQIGFCTKAFYPFFDSEIDQIRTIADKKRKEMGWK